MQRAKCLLSSPFLAPRDAEAYAQILFLEHTADLWCKTLVLEPYIDNAGATVVAVDYRYAKTQRCNKIARTVVGADIEMRRGIGNTCTIANVIMPLVAITVMNVLCTYVHCVSVLEKSFNGTEVGRAGLFVEPHICNE